MVKCLLQYIADYKSIPQRATLSRQKKKKNVDSEHSLMLRPQHTSKSFKNIAYDLSSLERRMQQSQSLPFCEPLLLFAVSRGAADTEMPHIKNAARSMSAGSLYQASLTHCATSLKELGLNLARGMRILFTTVRAFASITS